MGRVLIHVAEGYRDGLDDKMLSRLMGEMDRLAAMRSSGTEDEEKLDQLTPADVRQLIDKGNDPSAVNLAMLLLEMHYQGNELHFYNGKKPIADVYDKFSLVFVAEREDSVLPVYHSDLIKKSTPLEVSGLLYDHENVRRLRRDIRDLRTVLNKQFGKQDNAVDTTPEELKASDALKTEVNRLRDEFTGKLKEAKTSLAERLETLEYDLELQKKKLSALLQEDADEEERSGLQELIGKIDAAIKLYGSLEKMADNLQFQLNQLTDKLSKSESAFTEKNIIRAGATPLVAMEMDNGAHGVNRCGLIPQDFYKHNFNAGLCRELCEYLPFKEIASVGPVVTGTIELAPQVPNVLICFAEPMIQGLRADRQAVKSQAPGTGEKIEIPTDSNPDEKETEKKDLQAAAQKECLQTNWKNPGSVRRTIIAERQKGRQNKKQNEYDRPKWRI